MRKNTRVRLNMILLRCEEYNAIWIHYGENGKMHRLKMAHGK